MQTSALNLHQLATFQVVARHCSFVRAAEELHFSQPAVSAQIRHLEKSLGVKLFDQIGRKTDFLVFVKGGYEESSLAAQIIAYQSRRKPQALANFTIDGYVP